MATLLISKIGSKVVGRCDEHCHNAEQPVCNCICKGANHGIGLTKAIKQKEVVLDEIIENMTTEEVPEALTVQRPLFE